MKSHHLEAIKYSVEIAKKRKVRLEALKYTDALTRAQEHELEMTNDCIKRGEAILAAPPDSGGESG